MSKALWCDRCGKSFSPVLIGVTDLVTTIPELKMQNRDEFARNICYQRKHDLNFCPTCTNDFLAFMEDFKNETETISAAMSFAERDDPYLNADDYLSGRYKHDRTHGDRDCEAAEWPDNPK